MNQYIKSIFSLVTLPYYWLLGLSNKEYLIAPNGIGEILTIIMYTKEYIKIRDIGEVIIVINTKRRECCDIIDCNYIRFILVNDLFHKLMVAFGLSKYGNKLIPQNVRFVDSWNRQKRLYDDNFTQIKKLMGIKGMVNDFTIIPKKKYTCNNKIYFNPYSRTIDNVEIEIYEEVARLLSDKYELYTFVNGKQRPIKGTRPVTCKLYKAIELVNQGKCLVGTRSGFIDLMTLSETKIICLYPNMTKDELFFSFSKCEWNNNVIEFSVFEQDVANKIYRIIGG